MVYQFTNNNYSKIHVVYANNLLNAIKLLNNFKIDVTKLKLI